MTPCYRHTNGSAKLKPSSRADGSGLVEVVVDIPDSLKLAAQIEAKRVGQSLQQWLTNALTAALADDLNGEDARGRAKTN